MVGFLLSSGTWQENECLSVSELTSVVKSRLEESAALHGVLVKGEVSNFKHHSSGHLYFTLKDAKSRLRCVMFRNRSSLVRFRVEDGLTVVLRGDIGVYEAAGDYQLYVEDIYPTGQGALFLAFEQLKQRLAAEGLFAAARKRPLPFLPHTVGVVTSPTGAAIRDILSVMHRRNPAVNILIAPALVQGEGGPASVVAAIELLNKQGQADVLIVGRGGGSLEELWTFNEEIVARAIAASAIPVISAVGHETDFTIADFVADHRAPTPSAAAELAVPEQAALIRQVREVELRMAGALSRRVRHLLDRLRLLKASPGLTRPLDRLNQFRQQLDEEYRAAEMSLTQGNVARRAALEGLVGKLDSLSPLATLARGYAICQLLPSGDVVKKAAQVQPGAHLLVRLAEGEVHCQAQRKPLPSGQATLPL